MKISVVDFVLILGDGGALGCRLGHVWFVDELELSWLAVGVNHVRHLAILTLDLVIVVRDRVDVVGFRALYTVLKFGFRGGSACDRTTSLLVTLQRFVSYTVLMQRDSRIGSETARQSAKSLRWSFE